jgi:predicted AAA+ superfamily ATPase
LLTRIADALDRLAPPSRPTWDMTAARLFQCDGENLALTVAPDYPLPVELLLGVDRQKRTFGANLDRFARGLPANAALLWGVRGTGKSSLVKSAFMAAARQHPNLRLIEIEADDLEALPRLFANLRSVPEQVVVFCDDLSFEEGAGAAKALKSALEGGVAGPPANVLFVATSNRRHLMPREHASDDAIAAAEDAEETVSVSDRFGLWIGFPPMDQPTYLAAVTTYAAHADLQTPDLERRALQWSMQRGGRSGRVAMQFIRDLAGDLGRPLPF